MVDGQVSHDKITRFLSERDYTSKDLWQKVKPTIRQIERADGVLIFDDTIQEKEWTDESELMRQVINTCMANALKFRFVLIVNHWQSMLNLRKSNQGNDHER